MGRNELEEDIYNVKTKYIHNVYTGFLQLRKKICKPNNTWMKYMSKSSGKHGIGIE